ncbi:conidiation protein Con-6 [Aspergillus sclerotialis]|uniref:Conidiation protein Con-6 n=1 Tax=Aspergillus sclerotialis TaxID=2070753 RepID=A0A3A2ZSZ4_9EURO|nr:conidiation protein Con-6 [Aspergillus sclerotialis]
MSYSRENPEVSASGEDRVNAMRGYKATLSNPNTSKEAKEHAQDVLNNELGGNKPRQDLYDVRGRNKEPNRVAGGLKAAQTNPRVKEQGKKSSAEKLDQMPQE